MTDRLWSGATKRRRRKTKERESSMKRTSIGLVFLIAVVVSACGGLSASASAQAKPASAYDQLPTRDLIRELSLLGMTELLKGLEKEIPASDTSAGALATRARIRVGRAHAMADPAEGNGLFDEAIPLLRQAVKTGEKTAKTDQEILDLLNYQLELAALLGRHRVENPHILRLRHLQGSSEDRKVILKFTREAVDIVDQLKEDIEDQLADWRPDMDKLMTVVPRLEDLKEAVKYNAGWIRLHRAMALENPGEKTMLCRDLAAEMRSFTKDAETGVMYWALYVTGVAQRLQKKHGEAQKFLDKAAVPEAKSNELRQRAWFERARNRIEQGDPAASEKAIEEFRRSTLALWGPQGKVMVDLRVVLLTNYLHELQAAKQEDPAKAKALREKAQAVLLSFVEAYADRPGIVKAFLDIVATKFADLKDLRDASAVVILAKGYSKLASKDEKDQAEGERLLRMVLNHKDMKSPKIAGSILPGVLWELAILRNKAKKNLEAAKYFVALAQLHPKNRMASRSAMNAVRSLHSAVQERARKKQEIKDELRLEFIRALRTLVTGWGDEADNVKWNYDLATHCTTMAAKATEDVRKFYWEVRAVAAFERIPPELVEYMESQHSALELRTQIVLDRGDLANLLKADNQTTKQVLRSLAMEILPYEQVDLAALAAVGGPTTASVGVAAPAPKLLTAEAVTRRAEALAKELTAQLKTYSDPKALIDRLKTFSAAAEKDAADTATKASMATGAQKKEQEALAAALRSWAADADYQAAVIKYEQLPVGMKPAEREAVEKEALADLRRLMTKWAGTAVLRKAYEFEIRKLIERGQTELAIGKIREFRGQYAEQADQLIKLIVSQIRQQIAHLKDRSDRTAIAGDAARIREELSRYQLAYVSFAETLYKAAGDGPIELAKLDKAVRDVDVLKQKSDAAALRQHGGQFAKLLAEFHIDANEVQADKKVLDEVLDAFDRAAGEAEKKQLVGSMSAAAFNAYTSLRNAVQERYALRQMYADALIEKGAAEEAAKQLLQAKAAFQKAFELFTQCSEADEQRRDVLRQELDAKYGPMIATVKAQANSMDRVKRFIDEFKRVLADLERDPAKSSDLTTLVFSYEHLRKAGGPEEEGKRLPRTVRLLNRAWENLLKQLKEQVRMDPDNVIGLARAHRGLKQYDQALRHYRMFCDGVDIKTHDKEYFAAQLERCQCRYGAGYDSRPALESLLILIRQLEIKDSNMGGLAPQFNQSKLKIQNRLKQLPKQE